VADAAQAAPPSVHFTKLAEADVATPYSHLHGGAGTVSLQYFRFNNTPALANFVVYDMPPGSSEGVRTHVLGNAMLGSYDEYYYIVEG